MEILNSLSILLLDLSLSLLGLIIFRVVIHFMAFNAHDAHKVVSWVGQLGASVFVTQGPEIVDGKLGLVKIDDFSLCKQHQTVKYLIDIGVWLMDGTYDCPSSVCKLTQGLYD